MRGRDEVLEVLHEEGWSFVPGSFADCGAAVVVEDLHLEVVSRAL